MAQTSVEWLIEQLSSKHIGFEMYVNANKETIEQAKEMHKQEIIDAVNDISENNVKYANNIVSAFTKIEAKLFKHNNDLAEQYYNKTFKGGNK